MLSFLAACETFPLGMSREAWEGLTPEQQAQARAEQRRIDSERQAAWEREQAVLQAEAAEAEARRQETVQAIYANPRYGEILEVKIEGGEIAFFGKRRTYEPIAFVIAAGEIKPITFLRADDLQPSLPIYVFFDGGTFYFDVGPRFDLVTRYSPTDRITIAGGAEWDAGETYQPKTLDDKTASEALNISITLRYRPVDGVDR